jgi:protein-S-isoprenylcysteine O-methyltransferase Ste14
MHALELKIPPPVVAALLATLMWLAASAVPSMRFEIPARRAIAACTGIAGLAFSISGVVSFRRARTTVNPLKPETASSLVVSGPYRLSRNPMYVGLALVLSAWAMLLAHALAFVFLPAFILYITRFQIRPEEEAMTKRFGEEYAAYRSRVRRWL